MVSTDTFTVIFWVTVPDGPSALRVYSVVAAGFTVVFPVAFTTPIFGAMVTLLAPDTSQERSTASPGLMLVVPAANEFITAAGCGVQTGVAGNIGVAVDDAVGVDVGVAVLGTAVVVPGVCDGITSIFTQLILAINSNTNMIIWYFNLKSAIFMGLHLW